MALERGQYIVNEKHISSSVVSPNFTAFAVAPPVPPEPFELSPQPEIAASETSTHAVFRFKAPPVEGSTPALARR